MRSSAIQQDYNSADTIYNKPNYATLAGNALILATSIAVVAISFFNSHYMIGLCAVVSSACSVCNIIIEFQNLKKPICPLARTSHTISRKAGQTVLPNCKDSTEGRVKLTLPRGYLKPDGETDVQNFRVECEKCGLAQTLKERTQAHKKIQKQLKITNKKIVAARTKLQEGKQVCNNLEMEIQRQFNRILLLKNKLSHNTQQYERVYKIKNQKSKEVMSLQLTLQTLKDAIPIINAEITKFKERIQAKALQQKKETIDTINSMPSSSSEQPLTQLQKKYDVLLKQFKQQARPIFNPAKQNVQFESLIKGLHTHIKRVLSEVLIFNNFIKLFQNKDCLALLESSRQDLLNHFAPSKNKNNHLNIPFQQKQFQQNIYKILYNLQHDKESNYLALSFIRLISGLKECIDLIELGLNSNSRTLQGKSEKSIRNAG